ncbi:MAG: CvpA family protein [Verrucomicrobia bacterium]|nr:CvpA family protein [Verrucomicrobiota bacterium]
MNPAPIPYGALDLLTLVVLFVGVLRGRKRGLSEELLDALQWVTIVVAGGLFYHSVSLTLGQSPLFSRLFYNVASYALIALVVKLFFSFLKRHLGEKIIGADLFGGFEYYLGMMGGMVRFACVSIFLLNFLHAPLYTTEDLAAQAKYQERWFSDIRFPTIGTIQQTVFKESVTGWAADKYLALVMIAPTERKAGVLRHENSLARRREQSIDAMVRGK